jgi:cytochrome bd-type quinol oxidase subunit 2
LPHERPLAVGPAPFVFDFVTLSSRTAGARVIAFLLNTKAAGVVLVLIIMAGLCGGALFMAKTAGNGETRAEHVVHLAKTNDAPTARTDTGRAR